MYATYKAAASGKLTTFGFRRNLERDFELGAVIGEGGFGVVRRCVERSTGRAYAAKLLPKRFLAGRGLEPHYAARVLHEVDALAAVGNSLNASHLVAAYEDDRAVALVMELCSGGPLLSRVKPGEWGERDAQRAVLDIVRSLAHCHSAGVLVRDVKPDNFLFRDASPGSPLKMIDFGLAVTLPPLVMVEPTSSPSDEEEGGSSSGNGAPPAPPTPTPTQKVTDRAGTPHFCAPEVLRMSYAYPADVWSAGVIAYLLLAGRFPWAFDPQVEEDERAAAEAAREKGQGKSGGGSGGSGGSSSSSSSSGPFGGLGPMAAGGSLSNKDLFRAILKGELDFERPPFNTPAVSEEARDCVRLMLRRDADARPSAAELLRHPWLVKAAEAEAGGGAVTATQASSSSSSAASPPPLDASLVQRLQRFGAYGRLRQLALRRVAHLALLEFDASDEEEGGNSPGGGKGGVLARVVREFESLPRDEDGRVPYSAVSDALNRYDLSEGEKRMLVLQLDADRDGRVDADEFCACMADWSAISSGGGGEGEGDGGGGGGGGGNGGGGSGKQAWARWLRAVFDSLDRDRSGRISAEELEDALCRADFGDDDDDEEGGQRRGGGADGGGGVEGERLCDAGAVAQALREADADGDGALSLAEFEALLKGGAGGGSGGAAELSLLFPARLRRRPVAERQGARAASAAAPSPPPSARQQD
jgi:calcium-dependent protein kinase